MRRIIFALVLLSAGVPSFAANLGTVGLIYPIVEKDLIEAMKEIMEANSDVWKKVLTKEQMDKKYRDYRPADLPSALPVASKDEKRTVMMSHTLERDVPDGKGGVLYPAGFIFNPLEYRHLTNIYVFLDGADARQVGWFQKSQYYGDLRTRVLLTRGSWWDVGGKLYRQVYYASSGIVEKFQIKRVPSIVTQVGKALEVTEIAVKPEEKK